MSSPRVLSDLFWMGRYEERAESSRPERIGDEISARLRRSDPAELEEITDDVHEELAELLGAVHSALRDLSEVITATQLAVPGGMQPLWGEPDERRVMPA